MAKIFNTDGKLVLSELTMDEKVELILGIFKLLEDVNVSFESQFHGEYFGESENEQFMEAKGDLGLDHVWTNERGNTGIIDFGGINFGVWGTAYSPYYLAPEDDQEGVVWGWLLSKNSWNENEKYRQVYLDASAGAELTDKVAWSLPYVTCPFCEPSDGQSPVECPIEDSRLLALSYDHEYSLSWTYGESF
jgi:hypothetical protein